MISRKSASDTGFSVAFVISTVMHLAVFLLLFWWNTMFPFQLKEQPTYFVDLYNLPVAEPRAGLPAPPQESTGQPALPERKPAAPLTVPAPSRSKPAATPAAKPSVTPSQPDSSAEFEERMNRIRSKTEAQQQEAKLEELRRSVAAAGNARPGMPLASGSQAGSDYLNYITSRLTEVFTEPPNTGKDLFALIRIRISAKGRAEMVKIMKSSGNIAFDNYAVRSVYEAEKSFPPPPAGKFEFVFKFKPQGISSR